ncbi:MAG: aminotransferase [Firmicutes bacterium]|nr:aminotransferase [Bacillota bacterium]
MEGVSDQTLAEWDRAFLWHPLTQQQSLRDREPLPIIVGGEGCYVFTKDGRRLLDAVSGLWCVNVGYGRSELAEAGARQLRELAYYPLTMSHPRAIELAAKLAAFLPDTPHIYFSNSGSEANEVAFKVVRQYWKQRGRPNKVKILSRARSYHGSTLGALAATGQPERRRDYEPLAPGFLQVAAPYCYRCPFSLAYPACGLACAEDFRRRIEIEGPETVAAVIVEPVTAGGGVLVPPPDYLPRIQAICQEYDVKLIVDEVVTGFGRLGRMFGHQLYGVRPDIVTLAKGLASGYMPIAATAFSDEIFEAFLGAPDSGRHLRHVNTFGGHPVAAAVALANIGVIEREDLCGRSREQGRKLGAWLRESLADVPQVAEVRGEGLFIGIELVEDRGQKFPLKDRLMRTIYRHALTRGVIVGRSADVEAGRNNILILAPPLVIADAEMEALVDVVRESLVATFREAP